MIKAVFFDLFFTLIDPQYSEKNEYDVIGISAAEWEKYAEDDALYRERALGSVRTEKEIIDSIDAIMPYHLNESQKQEILQRREERMRRALYNVDTIILTTLRKLHDQGIKIALISNADMIDSKYWYTSPLSEFFDAALFSCNVGILKPQTEIYRLAMDKLGIMPEESIFVGDGGFDELYGAKRAGMKTVFTEYLDRKSDDKSDKIRIYADFHIDRFDELLNYID